MTDLSIGTVVLGVDDVARATEFWTTALDYVPREEPSDDTWVILVPRNGAGTPLALGKSESPVQEIPRTHLDLYTKDQSGEVERLIALGATRVDWHLYPADPDFVVLADPDRNRFCVIDTTHHIE
jgi:catechol 2,3-dioxygenase-like lactoylglutathione lyase family enzyme